MTTYNLEITDETGSTVLEGELRRPVSDTDPSSYPEATFGYNGYGGFAL